MKIAVAFVISLYAHFGFAANTNPHHRICREVAADAFLEVSVPDDSLPLCRFGVSFVSTQLLMNLKWYNQSSQALEAYAKTSSQPSKCGDAGGMTIPGHVGTRDFYLCAFSDGSFFELDTFEKGVRNSANARLNQALGL